jgi:ATP diphosphatase
MNPDELCRPTPSGDAEAALRRFLGIITLLRSPNGGCPWDLKQTFESLRPQLLEEAYEVADAVAQDRADVCEELGDLLSVMGLFAQIASEEGSFSFESIITGISEKLVRRHPHVFGNVSVSGTEEVLKNWEAIKQTEKPEAKRRVSLMDGVPRSMPALLKAHHIGEKCHRVGFDWSSAEGVMEKVREELDEFEECLREGASEERRREEFGDLLFSLGQYARHLGFNAEEALASANDKFVTRFKHMESFIKTEAPQTELSTLSTEAWEELWQRAKQHDGQKPRS